MALMLLSFGTVLIASTGRSALGAGWIAGCVLTLAGLKARIILARYLGLARSRFWTRAFDLVIGVFLAVVFGVYLLGSGAAP
jgi:hypothetical protein